MTVPLGPRHTLSRVSLSVYEHALSRVAEVKDDARARRGEVELVIGSSYPLRALGRPREARQRLDGAFARLQQLKMYPADKIDLGSETDAALRALAAAEHPFVSNQLSRR